ncbi:MAG: hypothetical protein KKG93_14080 [Bacteroidetes bacterium]|nr:hypothetical protein [Bacteroidota bacterium]
MKYFVVAAKLMLIVCFFSIQSFAQNSNDALRLSEPGVITNAVSLGTANSNLALDNYAAVQLNPAALGSIRKFQLTGGLLFNSLENETAFFNSTTQYSQNSMTLNQLGIAYPLPTARGSLVFGFGYSKVKEFNGAQKFNGFNSSNHSMIQDLANFNDDIAYDLGLSYPLKDANNNYIKDTTGIAGNLNQSGLILQEGSLNSWSFSGAVEISPNLFVGASFNIYTGAYRRDREYYEDDTKNLYSGLLDPNDSATEDLQSFFLNDIIDWDLSGWDMKLGLLFKPDRYSSFAAAIKLPTQYTIRENYYIAGSSYFKNNAGYDLVPYDETIEYDIQTPFELSLGGSYSIAGLTVSGSGTMIDYTQMEFTDGLTTEKRITNNKQIKDDFTTTFGYNLGLEYEIPYPNIKLRGGFMTIPSPYKADPSEFDKMFLTGGVGFVLSKVLVIDAAYSFGWWETYGDNYGENLSRTFQTINRSDFIVSLTYRM